MAQPAHSAPILQTEDWAEEEFVAALAELERIQRRIDRARAIPGNIVNTLTRRSYSNPQDIQRSYMRTAKQSIATIDDLKKSWEDAATWRMIQQFGQEKNKHIDLVRQYEIGLWGWVSREEALSAAKQKDFEQEKIRNTEEDETAALAEYAPKFKTCAWDDEDKTRINVEVDRAGTAYRFEIRKRGTKDGVVYDVTSVGGNYESEAISTTMWRRPSPQDIFATLEMLVAYGDNDLAKADCAKCGQYFGLGGSKPFSRRKQRIASDKRKGQDRITWVALHESCL
ncbi:hypothetical protein BT63DRAFT_461106 [Microthyrium microscopicum]|uniref:Uncharacterized protein n=1 Tax=Microthyrium microscopicum TaxID=703497 RepID=A0A6A6TV86_9PEZI|nr:hypothetical protein BT63DRAFT_461106 [Microthyrium microscopicum]